MFYGKAKPVSSGLYSFTTHTFTNASATGRNGPIISQVRSAYSAASWAQNASYQHEEFKNGLSQKQEVIL